MTEAAKARHPPEFQWHRLRRSLAELGAAPDRKLFDRLQAAYAGAGRYYHTATHVAQCLKHFERLRHRAHRSAEIEAALWFHDAVYDPRRDDSEARSAEWARSELLTAGADRAVAGRVADMILATRTHEGEGDCALLIDVDLAILGAPETVFEAYDQAIRREFQWLPERTYRAGRSRILATFLDRPRIYRSDEFRRAFESRARRNLARKIADLSP